MFEFFSNCFKYAHLVSELGVIEHGRLSDVIELKAELMSAQYSELNQENKLPDSETHDWGSAILLKDKIEKYKQLKKAGEPIPDELMDEIKDLIESLF